MSKMDNLTEMVVREGLNDGCDGEPPAPTSGSLPVVSSQRNTLLHAELIAQAARWLEKKGHVVVITDMTHGGGETADAIGWHGHRSTLIEVKVSRPDFFADAQKCFRRMPDRGMGGVRYYCTPRGLLAPDEVPPKWGLLEWDGKRLVTVLKPETFAPRGYHIEIGLLVSALRRVAKDAPAGVSVKCYTYETKNRATLGVAREENTDGQRTGE